MNQERREALIKKIEECGSGFYFDVTRYDLDDKIIDICSNVISNKDYNKFVEEMTDSLFNKIYIEGECWEPKFVLRLIDIVFDAIIEDDTKVSFAPASVMIGNSKPSIENLKKSIVEGFNNRIKELSDHGMLECML